ncbi:MAG: peptidase M1 [Flammeovirgaceae bacterium]|nr:peptidase M1 [Flammeovirgaceae bacterium]
MTMPIIAFSQGNYWQQEVNYKMEIEVDVERHKFNGHQTLYYTNNSPDTLFKVYYHLYFNAFQPDGMMDVRSRSIQDPDDRVMDRISKLNDHEIGYHIIKTLSQDGTELSYKIEYTVLEVQLAHPIFPGTTTELNMDFKSQIPIQIRRSGRDNKEGISYSMAQWYPKIAAYDARGWHADPYVAREFYAPWGQFDVSITINRNYVVAASGTLENNNEIGYGYQDDPSIDKKNKGKMLTWHFINEKAHDFMWAADPDYIHQIAQVPKGPKLHFFYQQDRATRNWKKLPEILIAAFKYMNAHFGTYPFSDFYVIQGGDGGMEYPMSTLITGHRDLLSLVGVTVHEALHSWYQGVLATNESYYHWMDEGYTSYASSLTMDYLIGAENDRSNAENYVNYFNLVSSGQEEPMSTHADYFETNFAYKRAAYSKGAVSLSQLGYIVGETCLKEILLNYFDQWKFKHPDINDFIKVAEKTSSMELDWYYDYWIYSTKTIDYAIQDVQPVGKSTQIKLQRIDPMPMPIDLVITLKNGSKKCYYIPLGIMRANKKSENAMARQIMKDWHWTHPSYDLFVKVNLDNIKSIEIDPSQRMADIDRSNNSYLHE